MDDLQNETAREQVLASLTARERDLVAQVLRDHPSLTAEKNLAMLRATGM